MDIEEVDEFLERKIIIGLITNDDYISKVDPIYTPDCLEAPSAKILAKWCFEHFKKYNDAPKKDIEAIYAQKVMDGLPKETATDIQDILLSLSGESKYRDIGRYDYLLEMTVKHFQAAQARAQHERQEQAIASNNWDEFYRLHDEFKPISISKDQNINAADLYDMDIQGPKWLIKNLIPTGLTILGGRSKVGKSYFMLNVAMALAQAKPIFGDEATGFKAQRGRILYLSLEDTKQRLQRRMREIDPEPNRDALGKNMWINFHWDKLNKGGAQAITKWVHDTKWPRLVVIDTLAKVWSKSSKTAGGGLYAEEYAIYSPLADLAHNYGISIVLVTHTTKSRAEDVFDEILGGMGTQGPADNLIVLANDYDQRKRFSIRSKDMEEKHLAFATPEGPAVWQCLGEVDELQKSAARQEIVDVLKESGKLMTLQQIRDELKQRKSSSVGTAHVLLRRLVDDGVLEQSKKFGPYQMAGYRNEVFDLAMRRPRKPKISV